MLHGWPGMRRPGPHLALAAFTSKATGHDDQNRLADGRMPFDYAAQGWVPVDHGLFHTPTTPACPSAATTPCSSGSTTR